MPIKNADALSKVYGDNQSSNFTVKWFPILEYLVEHKVILENYSLNDLKYIALSVGFSLCYIRLLGINMYDNWFVV